MSANIDLKKVFLFQDLDAEEIKSVQALCKEATYPSGQGIFFKGTKAESFYLIKHGSVKVSVPTQEGDDVGIKVLAAGSHFGEMSFIDKGARSATVQAQESTTLIEIPYKAIEELTVKNQVIGMKIYRAFATYLSHRLRATTEDLGALRELKLRL